MSLINRYSNTIRGGMVFTGNTLGFSDYNSVYDGVAAFTSLNPNLKVDNFPQGSTTTFTSNGSYSYLNIPENSKIVYAELVWSANSKVGNQDIFDYIDSSVVLTTPDGETHNISCDDQTAQDVDISYSYSMYTRSSNVTDILKNYGSGKYCVSKVPALVNQSRYTSVFAGWTLAVVYEDKTMDFDNINIYVGVISITTNQSDEYDITGFTTVGNLPLTSKLYISAGEGDCNREGDSVYFGKIGQTLTKISGPNNDENNFFASQINGSDGQLDTSGSFGNLNQTPGASSVGGVRQGYDITTVDVSNLIELGQTNAAIKLTTSSDVYFVNCLGLTIEGVLFDKYLIHTLEVDKKITCVGETLTYTHTLLNQSDIDVFNVMFTDIVPDDTEFVQGSVSIDGIAQPLYNPESGIDLGTFKDGQTKVVQFQVLVNGKNNATIENNGQTIYNYQLPDLSVESNSVQSNFVQTANISSSFTKIKSSYKIYLKPGQVATQMIILTNNSEYEMTDIMLTDVMNGPATYVSGSVVVNNTFDSSYDIAAGIIVPNIAPGRRAVISYQIKANEVVNSQPINNFAQVVYKINDPSVCSNIYTEQTNTVTIYTLDINVDVVKAANRLTVNSQNEIEYTIVVTNNDSLIKTNLFFKDIIPQGTTFVESSVFINGVNFESYNPNIGFELQDLEHGDSITILFKVIVD